MMLVGQVKSWKTVDIGCYGHPTVRTPYLDGLAQNGVKFTQFYSACNY